ncbi:uncharacterized protein [Lolium perenne]|uniref:uncharacterized protein n=1 Tax=Lolium perenne TaxID=4522 RepID=UPI0021F5CB88|nr:uncharacterized protein LOC127340264 [Lolium perenne]
MGLCLGKTSPCPRPDVTPKIAGGCLCPRDPSTWSWADLPPEITGLVFSRLPSHDDRLSLAAVCHDWRLATQHQRAMLPPALPYINLGNGVCHGLADGKARRFATFRGSYTASASFGSWLLYEQRGGSGRCFLRAPNSPAIKVPCLYAQRALLSATSSIADTVDMGATSSIADTLDMGTDVKMVVCSSRLVVAIFRRHTFGDILPSSGVFKCSNIACFRPARARAWQLRPATWSPVSSYDNHRRTSYLYIDIAFFQGKIFALTTLEELFCYDFFANDRENQQRIGDRLIKHATEQRPPRSDSSYLVVSSDKQKLLMVRWNGIFTTDHQPAMDLRVFEADFDEGQWSEVNDLAGQALFLSRNCSKAFQAGSLEHCDLGFRGGNCVFVLGNEWAQSWRRPDVCGDQTSRYLVYDMVSGETSSVTLDGAPCIERFRSGWFFPDE